MDNYIPAYPTGIQQSFILVVGSWVIQPISSRQKENIIAQHSLRRHTKYQRGKLVQVKRGQILQKKQKANGQRAQPKTKMQLALSYHI